MKSECNKVVLSSKLYISSVWTHQVDTQGHVIALKTLC
jgi:hypothetical protein